MYLDLTETGRRIGKSKTYVRDLIERGILPAYEDRKTGRRKVLDTDIIEYLSSFKRYRPADKTEPSEPLHFDN